MDIFGGCSANSHNLLLTNKLAFFRGLVEYIKSTCIPRGNFVTALTFCQGSGDLIFTDKSLTTIVAGADGVGTDIRLKFDGEGVLGVTHCADGLAIGILTIGGKICCMFSPFLLTRVGISDGVNYVKHLTVNPKHVVLDTDTEMFGIGNDDASNIREVALLSNTILELTCALPDIQNLLSRVCIGATHVVFADEGIPLVKTLGVPVNVLGDLRYAVPISNPNIDMFRRASINTGWDVKIKYDDIECNIYTETMPILIDRSGIQYGVVHPHMAEYMTYIVAEMINGSGAFDGLGAATVTRNCSPFVVGGVKGPYPSEVVEAMARLSLMCSMESPRQ